MARSGTSIGGLLVGMPALVAGFDELELHPISGILIALGAMALLLHAVADLCQTPEIES